MNASYGPIIGLAVFDVFLLVLFCMGLRAHAPLDRRALGQTAVGMMGFVFHAFLFFRGAFLYLQLATIAILLVMSWLASRKRVPPVSPE